MLATKKVEHQYLVYTIEDISILKGFLKKATKQGKKLSIQLENSDPVPILTIEELNELRHRVFFILKYGFSKEPLLITIYFVE